ncbi:hypothetical protein QNH20_21570 [Neobacillus sp. WH10]|uniref:hypothetical protein n=1 Tax=Neobacillus sp. WH10 TaxID=3047873 RepID=UPI0024C1D0A6|nr:hypothetical protein [Neobacillus sp. WH10]WHY76655.1 hypothetical protein QNH20_21570 [Neobacillus sp. WH10]
MKNVKDVHKKVETDQFAEYHRVLAELRSALAEINLRLAELRSSLAEKIKNLAEYNCFFAE